MTDINDLLGLAINRQPVEFSSALSDILSQKAQEAIEVRRIELAQGLYTNDEDVSPEAAEDVSDESPDLDIDDIDLDLEDLNDTEND